MQLAKVQKLFSHLSRDELLKIIAHLSARNKKADDWLLSYCSEKNVISDDEYIKKEQLLNYWSIALNIIKKTNRYGWCKDLRKGYEALDKLNKLIEENEFSWEIRKPLVDEMMEQFYTENYNFEDPLIDSCKLICQTVEEKLYLADKIKKTKNSYYRNYAADIFLKYGRDDEFVKIMTNNLKYGGDYIKLADYYAKQGHKDKAVKTVEVALDTVNSRMDEIYIWLFDKYKQDKREDKIIALYNKAMQKYSDKYIILQLMYEYYQQDYDKMKDFLLKLMKHCLSEDAMKWYDTCKKMLHKEDFEREEQNLRRDLYKKNRRAYFEMLLKEGNKDEIVDFIGKYYACNNYWDGIAFFHLYTPQLKQICPSEICDFYWNEANKISKLTIKERYRDAVYILTEIHSICENENMMDEWTKKFEEFKLLHKKKTSLLEMISKSNLNP